MKTVTLMLCAAFLLTGCPGNVQPDAASTVAVVACPAQLPALVDDTFGATVTKLVEVSGIYFKCRTSAIGASK